MKLICITTRENLSDSVFHLAEIPGALVERLRQLEPNIYALDDITLEYSFKRKKVAPKKVEGISLLYIANVIYNDTEKEVLAGVYHTGVEYYDDRALTIAVQTVRSTASAQLFRVYAEKAVGQEEFMAARLRNIEKFGGKLW